MCSGGIINCERQSLTCIPVLLPKPGNFHALIMSHNYITDIPNAAFSALNIHVTTLYLDHNNISLIHDFAFKGLETLKYLYLQHNRLQILPNALKYFLINVKELDVSCNPIDGEMTRNGTIVEGFIGDVAAVIGKTVTSFKFGDQRALLHWPRTLYHFQQLNELHISGMSEAISYIPPGQFASFENTLEKLTIENARLLQLPHDIGKIKHLKGLHIRHNEIFHGNDIVVQNVFTDIGDTLETLALENDNLTRSPEGFEHLIKMENLSLTGNPLKYLTDEFFDSLRSIPLRILLLRNCSLSRPPGALSRLLSLEELDLSDNNIRILERGDIAHMSNLISISFRGNPISYITRTAFFALPSLEYLDLRNTTLTYIPKMILNLYSIKTIDFTNSPIDCTCDMYWIKQWTTRLGTEILFKGDCETVDYPVMGYIDMRLPLCPQYNESPFG